MSRLEGGIKMEDKSDWINEVDNELKAVFNMCRCQHCNKEISKPPFTLLEHGYKHIHHFCNYDCLARWSEPYKIKKKA